MQPEQGAYQNQDPAENHLEKPLVEPIDFSVMTGVRHHYSGASNIDQTEERMDKFVHQASSLRTAPRADPECELPQEKSE